MFFIRILIVYANGDGSIVINSVPTGMPGMSRSVAQNCTKHAASRTGLCPGQFRSFRPVPDVPDGILRTTSLSTAMAYLSCEPSEMNEFWIEEVRCPELYGGGVWSWGHQAHVHRCCVVAAAAVFTRRPFPLLRSSDG
jgi:hypothetical protein